MKRKTIRTAKSKGVRPIGGDWIAAAPELLQDAALALEAVAIHLPPAKLRAVRKLVRRIRAVI